MNLYLLEQDENNGWDTFDACIVASRSEQQARLIRPDTGFDDLGTQWVKPEDVKVTLLGTALESVEPGIILASFNAG